MGNIYEYRECKNCDPFKKMAASEEHPFGTEWLMCNHSKIEMHVSRCYVARYTETLKHDNGKISKDKVDKMIILYKEGYSRSQIAEKVGVSKATVSRYLNDAGYSLAHKVTIETEMKIKELYSLGYTLNNIARIIHVDWKTVRKYVEG